MSNKLSRTMSYALRHSPENFGLTLDENGSVEINELAQGLNAQVESILDAVFSDSKNRFSFVNGRIWANSGHSTQANIPLTQLEHSGIVFHGTKSNFITSIIGEGGLLPQKRNYVHLSRDVATAVEVAERREGTTVLLQIDAGKMINDGHEVFSSGSSVLTRSVPWEYVVNVSVVGALDI